MLVNTRTDHVFQDSLKNNLNSLQSSDKTTKELIMGLQQNSRRINFKIIKYGHYMNMLRTNSSSRTIWSSEKFSVKTIGTGI